MWSITLFQVNWIIFRYTFLSRFSSYLYLASYLSIASNLIGQQLSLYTQAGFVLTLVNLNAATKRRQTDFRATEFESNWHRVSDRDAVWLDWAIYCTLGNFLKPVATIILPESATLLGNFCNLSFFSWNDFWATFTDLLRIFTGHTDLGLHSWQSATRCTAKKYSKSIFFNQNKMESDSRVCDSCIQI